MPAKKKEPQQVVTASLPAGESIRVPKLSHLVADRLRRQIVSRRFAPGDRLPTEAELLATYKVSYPTLREALRILEAESLIVIDRARPTVVGPTMDRAADYSALVLISQGATLRQLLHGRSMLEPSIVASIAERRDATIIQSLKQCVDDAEAALKKQDAPVAAEAINRFHVILCQASESQVLSLLAGMLHSISSRAPGTYLGSVQKGKRLLDDLENSTEGQRGLIPLLLAGRVAEAQRYWQRYFEDADAQLVRSGAADNALEQDP